MCACVRALWHKHGLRSAECACISLFYGRERTGSTVYGSSCSVSDMLVCVCVFYKSIDTTCMCIAWSCLRVLMSVCVNWEYLVFNTFISTTSSSSSSYSFFLVVLLLLLLRFSSRSLICVRSPLSLPLFFGLSRVQFPQ